VVLSIVAVLAAMLLDRLSKLRVEAERVTVAHVLGSLRSALALEVAAHMASGSTGAIEDLIGTNPMDRLSPQPENYLGALDDPDPAQIPRGRWYFNTNRQLLIYRACDTLATFAAICRVRSESGSSPSAVTPITTQQEISLCDVGCGRALRMAESVRRPLETGNRKPP
jgi:type II secretory pathway pseudopilin PulG